MPTRRWHWIACLALFIPLTVTAATLDAGADTRHPIDAWRMAAVAQLEAIDTADSLVSAALLLPMSSTASTADTVPYEAVEDASNPRRLELVDRAAARDRGAADIAALTLRLCQHITTCDASGYASRLQTAAPDDAGYLLPQLIEAHEMGDTETVDRLLAGMATATSLHSYYAELQARVAHSADKASDRLPVPPDAAQAAGDSEAGAAMLTLASIQLQISANPLAGLGALSAVCDEDQPQFDQRREACRHIGRTLSQDGTMSHAQIGLALWQRAARDEADLAQAVQARRTFDWQRARYVDTVMGGSVDPAEGLRATVAHAGELPGIIALLQQRGISTQPPQDWAGTREQRDLPCP